MENNDFSLDIDQLSNMLLVWRVSSTTQ